MKQRENAECIVMRSPPLASPADTLFWRFFTPHKITWLQ
jgi:hypothetical protein